MKNYFNKTTVIKKAIAYVVIVLQVLTVGPAGEALASICSSENFSMHSDVVNEGGISKVSVSSLIEHDSLGEALVGQSTSAGYILYSGFIATLISDPPFFNGPIGNFSWNEGQVLENAFDLDDYFGSPDGLALTYTALGNSAIAVEIDLQTHFVSFSQPAGWSGTEKVIFKATDTNSVSVFSNEVTLLVESVHNPPVLDYIPDIQVNETELVAITPHATDADGDAIVYTFTAPLDENGRWQTDYQDAGIYTVTVTAEDATGLTDFQEVKVTVVNVNQPPVLDPIDDIVADEGDTVVISPHATDGDGDAVMYYFSAPFDAQGKWLTGYDDEGEYYVTVTASDGIDTVSQDVNVTVYNVNRAPQANLSLSDTTVEPHNEISIQINAFDPDGDPMTFVIRRDGVEVASGSIDSHYATTTTFSDIGDHLIEAVVSDSGGLSDTVTQGVDVVDPNTNRDAINPIMGDFNGDSLLDVGLHNSDTGMWEICLSDRGSFTNAVDWLTGFGTSLDWIPLGGDFNGDAKSDVGLYNYKTGELKVALSSGSFFTLSGTWLNFSGASIDWAPFTGNFDGDKYTDFGIYNMETGAIRIALGNGSGFQAMNSWHDSFGGSGWTIMPGDFNGDGLTDAGIFRKLTGDFKVAFSTTSNFETSSDTWITGYGIDKDLIISDFNKDGFADIGWWDDLNYGWSYAISTGIAFIDKGVWIEEFGSSNFESAHTGDFDGNGVMDAAVFDKDAQGIERWNVRLSTLLPADLLVEIDNGVGGGTRVHYAYAHQDENSLTPFPVYVADSITVTDTLPYPDDPDTYESYIQEFVYAGAYFDVEEREFRGFEKVTVTDPVTGNRTETCFYQGKEGEDGALKGKIKSVTACDGNGKLISSTQILWEVRKAGGSTNYLGFPCMKQILTKAVEENTTSVETRDTYEYDNIGNVIETRNEGDITTAGDEKITLATYAPAYEGGYNLPLETVLKDAEENVLSKKKFEYDTRGNLAKGKVWLYNPISQTEEFISTDYTYDSFGNLTSSTNALGKTITYQYDTAFYTYVEKVINDLGHTVTSQYDPRFGVVVSVTDANGNTCSKEYDSLARVVQEKNTCGEVTAAYSYPDFNTKIVTQPDMTTREYVDGLGRVYRMVSNGEEGDSPRNVVKEIFFNDRGHKEAESLPHYEGADPSGISYVRYSYDIRGRLVSTTSDFPGTLKDAVSRIHYIDPLYMEIEDPQGNRKGVLKDIFGNNIEVTEFTQGGVYTTRYEYDLKGDLVKTIDSQGNVTEIWYDSLARKIKMDDPDTGVWTYEYDRLGNLTKQTDAKGQVIEFAYDSINRLTQKTGVVNQETTVLATYIYDDATRPNSVGRLSKVVDSSGSTEFFYDREGREIKTLKKIGSTEYVIEHAYDALNRLTSIKYPDGEIVNYTYDANSGLLEKVTGADTYVEDIKYNASGQIKQIRYGNSTLTTYSYGQDQRLSRIFMANTAFPYTPLQDLNYDFDLNGNLTTLTDNVTQNIRGFAYDDLNRLMSATNIPDSSSATGYTDFHYQYDSIGNMTYKSDIGVMTYGEGAGPHAVTYADGYSYLYDANGNMTSGRNRQMEYDCENNLISVTAGSQVTRFSYDGDGGRVQKTDLLSGEYTVYIGELYESHSDGLSIKHIFAGSQKVCSLKSDESIFYYHKDHIHSSNIITDGQGNLITHYEYSPYGSLTLQTGDDVTPFKFTGQELDDSTGLYYFKARYYDPVLGRFITPDSIVPHLFVPQSLNHYSYCMNNPVKYVDPTGHFPWIAVIIGAIIGGAAGGIAAYNNGGEVWKGALFGAISGAIAFGTIASAEAALILKFSAGFQIVSQVTGAIPGNTWADISTYSGYAAQGLAAVAFAWEVGKGIKDWVHDPRAGWFDLNANPVSPADIPENSKILVNGITTEFKPAIQNAIEEGADYLFYNPTSGPVADLTESLLQKITFTSSVDRQLASGLRQISGKISIIAHSQGTIVTANALLNNGLRGQANVSSVNYLAAAVSQPRAFISAWMSGSKAYYGTNFYDPINLAGPNINPFKFLGGLAGGIIYQAKFHTLDQYQAVLP
ncbi:MAG: hypothetical protein JW928_04660 [Candidatus Aureabacteria bacterium]|nr:hypothetical protein [Candidatus Auribacterota bacterium]